MGIPTVLERLVHDRGLAQIAGAGSARRFQGGSGFQIMAAAVHIGGFDFGQAAAEPAVGEGAVGGDGLFKEGAQLCYLFWALRTKPFNARAWALRGKRPGFFRASKAAWCGQN